jgi:hypothetical protein
VVDSLSLLDGFDAIENWLLHGHTAQARDVAEQVLTFARVQAQSACASKTHRKQRQLLQALSISYKGDWPQAEALFQEGLNLRRQVADQDRGKSHNQEELACSLVHLSNVPPGQPTLLAEASKIYQTLTQQHPDVSRYAQRLAALRAHHPLEHHDAQSQQTK